MSQPKLTLEVLSGPFDGQIVTLESTTEWSKSGSGVLSFPWDGEMGTPQARFIVTDGKWWLEPIGNRRSTRRNGEAIKEKVALSPGDWLKAAETWLLVRKIGEQSKE